MNLQKKLKWWDVLDGPIRNWRETVRYFKTPSAVHKFSMRLFDLVDQNFFLMYIGKDLAKINGRRFAAFGK